MKTKRGVLVLLVIVNLCLFTYFLHKPWKTSETENRTLMTFDMVVNNQPEESSIVYRATAAERLEEALKDQFIGRNWITVHYSGYTALLGNAYNKYSRACSSVFHSNENVAVTDDKNIETDYERWPVYGLPRLEIFPHQDYSIDKIGPFFRFNNTDYIVDAPKFDGPDSQQVQAHAAQIEHIHELYPEIKLYSYFVSTLNSTKWFDGQIGYDTPDYFELIAQSMPEYMKVKRLIYSDEAGYEKVFYKSDHHWSYQGSIQGYEDIYSMIAEDYINISPVQQPIKIWNFSELYGVEFRGTRARNLQNLYDAYDEFIVPEYDLGNRKCYSINTETGKETPVTLCLWDAYKSGEMSKDRYYAHYARFYSSAFDDNGNDMSNEYYLIRNEGPKTGHNLLLVTDSMGRPMRDVLGTHFDSEIYLDYNRMPSVKVDEIIEKYNIDTIVINGAGIVLTEGKYNFHFMDGFGEEEK